MAWHRTSSGKRGYGWEWMKLRDRVMKRDRYLCQPCERNGYVTQATAVDHILPKSQGGDDGMDNLQAICNECHETKTIEESGGKRRQRVGLDGWPVAE